MGIISQKRNIWRILSAPKIVNLNVMKQKKNKASKPKLPEGFTIDPSLSGKYDNQPLFKDKVDRANHILKTVGLPKFDASK